MSNAVVHQVDRAADGSGVSIASRWPIGATWELDLRVTPGTEALPYGALIVEVLGPDPLGRLLIVTPRTAFPYGGERERELQAVKTAAFVEARIAQAAGHVVLAGDFNAAPEAASVRFWRGQQSLECRSVCYADAWAATHPDEAGHTFTPHNPLVTSGEMPLERGRRIDYILVRCGDHGPSLDVSARALAFAEPVDGVWASDHCGVVADLAMPSRRPGP